MAPGRYRKAQKGRRGHGRTIAADCNAVLTSITTVTGPFRTGVICAEVPLVRGQVAVARLGNLSSSNCRTLVRAARGVALMRPPSASDVVASITPCGPSRSAIALVFKATISHAGKNCTAVALPLARSAGPPPRNFGPYHVSNYSRPTPYQKNGLCFLFAFAKANVHFFPALAREALVNHFPYC